MICSIVAIMYSAVYFDHSKLIMEKWRLYSDLSLSR